MEVKEKVYSFLEDIRSEIDFRNSENFIEDGYLDSFDIIELVSDIEGEYQISLRGIEVIPENFETIDSIVALIKKHLNQ